KVQEGFGDFIGFAFGDGVARTADGPLTRFDVVSSRGDAVDTERQDVSVVQISKTEVGNSARGLADSLKNSLAVVFFRSASGKLGIIACEQELSHIGTSARAFGSVDQDDFLVIAANLTPVGGLAGEDVNQLLFGQVGDTARALFVGHRGKRLN